VARSFFFQNSASILSCFAPARRRKADGSSLSIRSPVPSQSPASRKPHFATLTLVNPDVLVDTVGEKLPEIMEFAEHFTTYNDEKDGALFWSKFVQNYIPGCLKHGTVQPAKGRRPVIFGSVVSPLWLELEPGTSTAKLRGPVLELPTTKNCFKVSERSLMQSLAGGKVQSDPRIDVIDCSTIDQNIHKLRHNYYMLNTQVVEDICELIGSRAHALQRTRLVRVEANVFNFLCPPAELIDL